MICIIPARGGSTRLPGKNTAEFWGRPILHWVIEIAKQSRLFDEVVVSSDDLRILDVASAGGADICGRPDHLQGDVPEAEVLKFTAQTFGADSICRIYPFAALLTLERLKVGYSHFYPDPVFGVRPWECVLEVQRYAHSPLRAMRLSDCGTVEYVSGTAVELPTQDLPPMYHDAGTYMFCTTEALDRPLAERSMKGVVVPEIDCQDIDDAQDFELAKLKFMRGRI